MKDKENIEPQLNTLRCPSELDRVNREGAKIAKGAFWREIPLTSGTKAWNNHQL